MTKQLIIGIGIVFGAGSAALALVAASTGSAEAARAEPAAEDRSRVCVGESSGARAAEGWHPAALALVVASTPEPHQILAALEEQLDLAEESNNPMALDLEPDDGSELKRLRSGLWPRVNAAQAWLRPPLGLVPCSDSSARHALWSEHGALPAATPLQRQQAWATVSLAVVRSGDPERLRSRLRARSAEPDSTIAIAVGPLVQTDGVAALGARATKLAEQARRAGRTVPPLLALLAGASESGELPIALGAGDVAVVPRQAALARLADFTAELERALDAADRFVHRPEPIVVSASPR